MPTATHKCVETYNLYISLWLQCDGFISLAEKGRIVFRKYKKGKTLNRELALRNATALLHDLLEKHNNRLENNIVMKGDRNAFYRYVKNKS